MALELRQSLSLTQQLIMTPQLQQAIKLLQLTRLELLETINQEMETNPVLEEQPLDEADEEKGFEEGEDKSEQTVSEVSIKENVREDVDWESYLSEYNTGWAESSYEQKDIPSFEDFTSQKTNLHSHLMWQLNMGNFNDLQKEIGIHIIGNLDDDGYLKISIEEISQTTGHIREEVTETLSLIQKFDPVGVAARDTQECLLIQARFQNLGGLLVEKIILEHMDRLENKRYDLIARSLSIPLSRHF